MKDTEIHKGLDKAEVRDLISKGIVDSFVNSSDTRVGPVDRNLPPTKRSVIYAQRELEKAKANLERTERLDALVTVMTMMGWEEFDVSDEDVTSSYGKLTMNFIGTPEEYKNLLNKLK